MKKIIAYLLVTTLLLSTSKQLFCMTLNDLPYDTLGNILEFLKYEEDNYEKFVKLSLTNKTFYEACRQYFNTRAKKATVRFSCDKIKINIYNRCTGSEIYFYKHCDYSKEEAKIRRNIERMKKKRPGIKKGLTSLKKWIKKENRSIMLVSQQPKKELCYFIESYRFRRRLTLYESPSTTEQNIATPRELQKEIDEIGDDTCLDCKICLANCCCMPDVWLYRLTICFALMSLFFLFVSIIIEFA